MLSLEVQYYVKMHFYYYKQPILLPQEVKSSLVTSAN